MMDLDKLEVVASAATPGPWEHDKPENMVGRPMENGTWSLIAQAWSIHITKEVRDANSAFIAAARTAVPELIWLEAEESARGADPRDVVGKHSMFYSTKFSTSEPVGNNPRWPMYFTAPAPAAPAPAQQNSDWTASGIDYDRAIHHNPDAEAWATLFVQTYPRLADKHDLMRAWFANAMMAMYDRLKNGAQQDSERKCEVCQGNDGDAPCAYPSENMVKCLRRIRLTAGVFQQDSERDASLKRLVRYDAVAVQNNGYDWGVEMVSEDAGRFVEFDDLCAAMSAPAQSGSAK
jgi:hypothetical protein